MKQELKGSEWVRGAFQWANGMNFGTWTLWCLSWLFGGLFHSLIFDCKLDKWVQDWWDITACMSYHGHLTTSLWGRDVALFPGWGGAGGLRWKQKGEKMVLHEARLSLRTTLNEMVGGVFICKQPCWLLTCHSFETDFWYCDQNCLFLDFFFFKDFQENSGVRKGALI